jgi:hypothetical protein
MLKPIVSLLCGTSLALTGCAGFPELPNEPQVSITDILTNVECEIAQALEANFQKHAFLNQWTAKVNLALNTDTKGGATGDITFKFPLAGSIVDVALAGAPGNKHNASGNFDYYFHLKDLKKCNDYDVATRRYTDETKRQVTSVLTGRTGVGDWMIRVAEGVMEVGSCPASIYFEIVFKIGLTTDGTLELTKVEVPRERQFTAGLAPTATRETGHKLTVTFGPAKREEPEILEDAYDRLLDRLKMGGFPADDDHLMCTIDPELIEAAPQKRGPGGQRSGQAAGAAGPGRAPVSEATQENLDSKAVEFRLQNLDNLEEE